MYKKILKNCIIFSSNKQTFVFSSVRLHVKKLLRVLCLDTCYHKYQRTLARLLDKRYYFFRNIAIVFGLFYQMRVCHCQGELCVYFSVFFWWLFLEDLTGARELIKCVLCINIKSIFLDDCYFFFFIFLTNAY